MSETEKEVKKNRRQALKKVLAGTAVAGVAVVAPKEWSKPLVDSVILPSHAQTSQLSLNYSGTNGSTKLPDYILDHLISTAHAQPASPTGLCINFNADMNTYNVSVENGTNPLFVSNGAVGTAETLLDSCGDNVLHTLTLANGPSVDGVPWVIHYVGDGSTVVAEGTAQSSDCTTDPSICD